jgi:rubrerythrin
VSGASSPDDGAWLSGALSETPLADEYHRIEAAFEPARNPLAPFDPRAHAPEVIAKARTWWLAMMRTEYESESTFVEMAIQLRAINEPLDVQAVTLRMAQDELRHAAIAARVVTALGGEARIRPSPARRAPAHTDCGPTESVLRSIIFGCCVSETVNAARLAKGYSETSDVFIKEAFRLLLADERLHAQFGFYYLESRRAWLEAHPEIRRSIARYLRFAFASLEQYMGAVPADARPLTDAERAIGLPDLTTLSRTFQETVINACIPGLERFGIDAAQAWRERSIEPPTP